MHSIIKVRRTGWGPSKPLPKLRENQSTQISWFVIWELPNRNLISLDRWPWARHKLPISVGVALLLVSLFVYRDPGTCDTATMPPCHHATMPPIMLSTWYTTGSASGDAVFRAGTSSRHVRSGAGTLQFCTLLSRLAWIHWPGALVSDLWETWPIHGTVHLSWGQTRFPKCESMRETNVSSCFIRFIPNFRPWGVPVW